MPTLAVRESWRPISPFRSYGRAQHFEQALGDELGAGVERGTLHEDDELIAAEASRRVALADHARQPRGDDPQELVAGGVPEGVVDVLEAVHVNVQRRHLEVLASRPGEHLLGVQRQHAVGQAGQGVVQRLVAELPGLLPNHPQGALAGARQRQQQREQQQADDRPYAEYRQPLEGSDTRGRPLGLRGAVRRVGGALLGPEGRPKGRRRS
jgi:hypothetical protein